MTPNLPPSITVNRNLASTIKNYIKANGGKNVSESELNAILQKVAKFDAERDAGKREGGSIFSGGSTYLGGTGTDFVVQNGQQIQFSAEEFNEIFKGYLNPIEAKTPEAPAQHPMQLQPLEAKSTPLVPDGIQNSENSPEMPQKPQGIDAETAVQNLDGKFLEREVNGQKQKIAVVGVNGEKVSRVVNEDGTLGDTLIPISTMGKNKYITQTEMNNKMRAALGLADNEEIPKDIKGDFVSIGGTPTLIFKKDGKVMDQAQLKEYVSQLQDQRVEKFDTPKVTEGQAGIKPTITDQEPVIYKNSPQNGMVDAENPVTPQGKMKDVGPVEYEIEVDNVNPQVQNPNSNDEIAEVSRQGVSGSYSLTAGEDGKGFNLKINMKVSGNGEASRFFTISKDKGNEVYFNEKTQLYSFRGIAHHRLSFLQSRMDFISQNISVNNAIYNDLLNKQKAGTELTDAEKSFIEAHLKNVEQYGLGIDGNGNLINILNE